MQAALLLLDLQLGECAQKALQAASKEQADEEQAGQSGLELSLCCSRAASLVGDDQGELCVHYFAASAPTFNLICTAYLSHTAADPAETCCAHVSQHCISGRAQEIIQGEQCIYPP